MSSAEVMAMVGAFGVGGWLDGDQLEGDQVGVAGTGGGNVEYRGGLQGGGFVVGKHDLAVCAAQG